MIEEEDWSKEQEANRKPGQKHPTPSPGFADRVFYESLLHQRPESKMARKWCLEYGVLKWADAEALCKELGVAINVTRPGKSPTNGKKARTSKSSSGRYDKQEAMAAEQLELGTGGAFEGIGLST
ncbi:hypothetical protein PybrP1_003245, partial [[Pythium] brassicae (nom. inval.)]